MTRFQTPLRSRTAVAVAFGLAGCMLSPTDDGRVASTTATLPFQGFVTAPSAPVQIRAWDFTANTMANIGPPVVASTIPTAVDGGPLYDWAASRVLPARFWRSSPGGGQCAAVGATAVINGATYNVITVEQDWGTCFNEHPSVGGFFEHCQSDNAPVAKIFTNSWAPVTITQALLNAAGAIASSQITLTLDNFTPTIGQFCSATNLAGCPPLNGDPPGTYQFFAPAASSLTQTGQPPLTFTIVPTRQPPMTIYIDNMSSSAIDFTTSGNRFVLGITFESAGPEIRMNCIDNSGCFLVGDPAFDLDSPRATLSFALALDAGKIVFTNAVATFTTSSPGDGPASAAAAISAAMTDKINNDPGIHAAINTAIETVIRQTSGLTGFPLLGLTIGGGTIQVLPGCPMD